MLYLLCWNVFIMSAPNGQWKRKLSLEDICSHLNHIKVPSIKYFYEMPIPGNKATSLNLVTWLKQRLPDNATTFDQLWFHCQNLFPCLENLVKNQLLRWIILKFWWFNELLRLGKFNEGKAWYLAIEKVYSIVKLCQIYRQIF